MVREITLLVTLMSSAAWAADPYPAMAPIEQYRSPGRDAEIALARSAAPPSISNDAEILVFGAKGYETAAPGKNGFTCLVERSWGADFDAPEFWNPKIRGPLCFNAAATHSILPLYRQHTEWALAGISRDEMLKRTRTAVAAGQIAPPEPGAMCYMMSKDAYLSDDGGPGGHWHPHLMFYLPRTEETAWGSNQKQSPVFGGPLMVEPTSLFIVTVPNWSDGSPGPMGH